MTVAGHVFSEFVIIHDIDSDFKILSFMLSSIFIEFFIVHEIDSLSNVHSVSWLMTLAVSGDKFVMIHDIDLSRGSEEAVSLRDRVSYLLPHTDVSLPDENTGVVDRLGEPELEHLDNRIR